MLPPETHASWLKAHRVPLRNGFHPPPLLHADLLLVPQAEWLLRAQEGLERGRDISLLERLEAGLEAGVR